MQRLAPEYRLLILNVTRHQRHRRTRNPGWNSPEIQLPLGLLREDDLQREDWDARALQQIAGN